MHGVHLPRVKNRRRETPWGELSSFTSPSLTTFDVPKRDLGRLAVICALDRMKTPRSINVRIELPYKMIIRDSTERRDD